MDENKPPEEINEKELVAKIVEAIDEGDEEKALLFLKRYRLHNLSPIVYAKLLSLLDNLLADHLTSLSEDLA